MGWPKKGIRLSPHMLIVYRAHVDKNATIEDVVKAIANGHPGLDFKYLPCEDDSGVRYYTWVERIPFREICKRVIEKEENDQRGQ